MKTFRHLSKVVIVVMLGGVAILDIAITLCSKAGFIKNWNAQAAKSSASLPYHQFVAAAHAAGAATSDDLDLGRHVRRHRRCLHDLHLGLRHRLRRRRGQAPDKTVMRAQWAAVGFPVLLCVWAVLAIGHIMPYDFLRAAAFQDFSAATKGYNLPYSTSFMSIAFLASGANWLVGLVAGIDVRRDGASGSSSSTCSCASAPCSPGAWTAWGRPWFTSINTRTASPIGMLGFVAAISAFLSVGYSYLFPSVLSGLFASGMQLVSVSSA